MKKGLAILFVVTSIIAVFAFLPRANATDTYVTLDINPSVELIVTPGDRVIYANALNEDGVVLLADLELVGKKIDVAVTLIIDKSIELGFIVEGDDETIVSVSTISENNKMGELMKEKIKTRINGALNDKKVHGHAEDKPDNGYQPSFILEARLHNVSPGYLFLAKKAVYVDGELTLEAALEMNVSDLQTIIREAFVAQKEVISDAREVFLTAKAELINTYKPQFEAFETQIADLTAQIEATEDETEKANLEASLAIVVDDYKTLRLEFKTELEVIKDAFVEEIINLKDALKLFRFGFRFKHGSSVEFNRP
jgi:hypothetical protein